MPQISVVITNHDRSKFLQRCLWHLSQQSIQDFEVILVDDNVNPEPPLEPQPFPITLIFLGRKERQDEYLNNAIGMNLAVQRASAPYLMFTDPEIYCMRHLLRRHLDIARAHTIIQPFTLWTEPGDESFVEENWKDLPALIEHLRERSRLGSNMFMNLACHKDTWDVVGGMDESLAAWGGQDIAFFHAATDHGLSFGELEGCTSVHQWHKRNHSYTQGTLRSLNLKITHIPPGTVYHVS